MPLIVSDRDDLQSRPTLRDHITAPPSPHLPQVRKAAKEPVCLLEVPQRSQAASVHWLQVPSSFMAYSHLLGVDLDVKMQRRCNICLLFVRCFRLSVNPKFKRLSESRTLILDN